MGPDYKALKSLTAEQRGELRAEFDAASRDNFFPERVIAIVTGLSPGKLALDRMTRTGMSFYRVGTAIRYRKSDVLDYMESVKVVVNAPVAATAPGAAPAAEATPKTSDKLADPRARVRANSVRARRT